MLYRLNITGEVNKSSLQANTPMNGVFFWEGMVACTSGRQCSSHTDEQIRPGVKLTWKVRLVSTQTNLYRGKVRGGPAQQDFPFSIFHFSLSKHLNRRHSNHHQHCLLGLRQNSIRSIPSYRARYTKEESGGMNAAGEGEEKGKERESVLAHIIIGG